MTEKVSCIKFLLDKLDGGLICHCDVFRHVKGMKPGTAEKRLRDWRHEFDLYYYDKPWPKGCGYQVDGFRWVFQRRFVKWLGRQVRAAEKKENQKMLDNGDLKG